MRWHPSPIVAHSFSGIMCRMEAPAATPEKLIFLDIDGCLNTLKRQQNGFTGIEPGPAAQMNALLAMEPTAQLVISSAWRYLCLNSSMTIQGFEALLLTHGINCSGRVFGCTQSDELTAQGIGIEPEAMPLEEWHKWLGKKGGLLRSIQVANFLKAHPAKCWVVLDDIELAEIRALNKQVLVNHQYGLRPVDVDAARVILK